MIRHPRMLSPHVNSGGHCEWFNVVSSVGFSQYTLQGFNTFKYPCQYILIIQGSGIILLSPMFNPQETILLEFNSCLNPNYFDIIEAKNLDQYLAEMKHFGKHGEEFDINDDLLRALGIKVVRNTFTVRGSASHIYIFISERFPEEVPTVFVSDQVRKNWKNKYYFENPEEVKKDGKYNLVMIVTKIQNEVSKNSMRIEYLDDFKNLKDTFDPQGILKSLSRMELGQVGKNSNSSDQIISQQFRTSREYLTLVSYYGQLSMLNDSLISDIRGKQNQLQQFQKKLEAKSYDLQRCKKQFATSFCTVQGIRNRFSKFSIVQFLQEKIEEMASKAQEIEKREFSVANFNEYKAVMRELKKLELKKEKLC